MNVDATNQNLVSDEERELSTKIEELDKKEDKTNEEIAQLDELETKRRSSFGARINEKHKKWKDAEERALRLEQELEESKRKIDDLSQPKDTPKPDIFTPETIQVGDKAYYTDDTLMKMVEAGKLTNNEAFKHQSSRLREEAATDAYNRIKNEGKQEKAKEIMIKDIDESMKNYPNLFKKRPDGSINPDFNPNDPLYIEVNSLY